MGFNVTGPYPKSAEGFCWCLDVIDYFTGKSWSFPLWTKAEAYGAVKALILKMENADRPPEGIEIYQSDHGVKVIMSTEFRAFLDERGIFWRTAPRRNPSYNGVVKRHIQSKTNMMRSSDSLVFLTTNGTMRDRLQCLQWTEFQEEVVRHLTSYITYSLL